MKFDGVNIVNYSKKLLEKNSTFDIESKLGELKIELDNIKNNIIGKTTNESNEILRQNLDVCIHIIAIFDEIAKIVLTEFVEETAYDMEEEEMIYYLDFFGLKIYSYLFSKYFSDPKYGISDFVKLLIDSNIDQIFINESIINRCQFLFFEILYSTTFNKEVIENEKMFNRYNFVINCVYKMNYPELIHHINCLKRIYEKEYEIQRGTE